MLLGLPAEGLSVDHRGAGFLGSHLAATLLNEGHEVSILDDLSTGPVESLRQLQGHGRMQYCIDSVANTSRLAELVDDCDIIFHLAAAVGVRLIVESPYTRLRRT